MILMRHQGHPPASIRGALELEEKIRHLIVSYIGINFQAPDAFYAPAKFVNSDHCRLFAYMLSLAKRLALKSL